MIRDLLAVLIALGFFGLLVWGANHEAPTTVKTTPVEHSVVTHEITCATEKDNYCYRYEVKRIVKE